MPRCFMAKKLKYPYQQWKSNQPDSQPLWPPLDRHEGLAGPGLGGPGACPLRGARPETPGEENGGPEDLSQGSPASIQEDLFRPYCLKDPVEYKYDRVGLQDFPFTPAYLACRNLEDLSTAQAILDLSAPHRTSPASPSPHLPDSHPMVNVNHLRGVSPTHPHVKTEHLPDGLNTVYKLNGGKTTAYTYEAFFASDGRSKKVPVLAEETKPKYTCSECGKHYATSSNLSRHRQTHRTLDSGNAKKCQICNKMYVSMPALSMHVLTHNLNHKCDVCGKAFSRPWLLQGHMRSHTGDKPYGCAHCGKSFADRSNLRAHMQTHSAFKNFNCKRCNKSFALKSYLNKHYESACFKDQPIPSIDTPPTTPSPSDLSDERAFSPENTAMSPSLCFSSQDCSTSSPSDLSPTSSDSPASQQPSSPERPPSPPKHIIHIPTPIFPYSQQLIKV